MTVLRLQRRRCCSARFMLMRCRGMPGVPPMWRSPDLYKLAAWDLLLVSVCDCSLRIMLLPRFTRLVLVQPCITAHKSVLVSYRVLAKPSPPFAARRERAVVAATTEGATQEVAEVLQWLSNMGVSGPAFDRLTMRLQSPYPFKLREQPSVAITEANFAALRDILHMTDTRVRLLIKATLLSACAWQLVLHPFCGQGASVTSSVCSYRCTSIACKRSV